MAGPGLALSRRWPAIVTPEESARIRARITRKPDGTGSRRRAEGLLSGYLRCAGCMYVLNFRRRHAATGEAAYGCRANARGQVCEHGVHVAAKFVEAEVEREYLRRFGAFKVTEVIEAAPEIAGLAVVEEAIRDTLAAMGALEADMPGLIDRLTELRAERDRLNAQPREVQSVVIETDVPIREHWKSADMVERRRLLGSAGVDVIVHPFVKRQKISDRFTIKWRGMTV